MNVEVIETRCVPQIIGHADGSDAIPTGTKRAPGVSVRLTRMGYSVASDGAITAPRVRRMIKQMTFELSLIHI